MLLRENGGELFDPKEGVDFLSLDKVGQWGFRVFFVCYLDLVGMGV